MVNSERGEQIIRQLLDAEDAVRALERERLSDIERWHDKEVYNYIRGRGEPRLPTHDTARLLARLLTARAALYRAQKNGEVREFRGEVFDGELGNEQMAQTIEAAVNALGEGWPPPDVPSWNELIPESFA
jgi:hypothetical protein